MKHKSNNNEKMPRMSRVTIEDSNKSTTWSVVRLARPANSLTTSCWHGQLVYVWRGNATPVASAVGH